MNCNGRVNGKVDEEWTESRCFAYVTFETRLMFEDAGELFRLAEDRDAFFQMIANVRKLI